MATNKLELLDELFQQLESKDKDILNELSCFVDTFNYHPVRNKTKNLSFDFKNIKTKETIMKIELKSLPKSSTDYGKIIPGLRLKFFRAKEYSTIFQEAVKNVIEAFNGKYTGCYGCGRCKGELQGYIYTYNDGRKVFRCGSELLDIPNFQKADICEMKQLIKTQIDYWNDELKRQNNE